MLLTILLAPVKALFWLLWQLSFAWATPFGSDDLRKSGVGSWLCKHNVHQCKVYLPSSTYQSYYFSRCKHCGIDNGKYGDGPYWFMKPFIVIAFIIYFPILFFRVCWAVCSFLSDIFKD